MSADILEFGEFNLDCERFELLRNGSPVRLERKPMELLVLLASSRGRLVSRSEIAASLWPGGPSFHSLIVKGWGIARGSARPPFLDNHRLPARCPIRRRSERVG